MGGGQIVGGRGCGKGQEGGGKKGVGGGWGKGARGWNLYLNEVLNKTGIITRLGCHNKCYDTKSWESPILDGFPHCNDIMFSKTRHNLAKKSPKMRCARDSS